jgi:hypothetical protein
MSFKAVQAKIASQGHSMNAAGAILASASRNASPAAKRANPNLMKVLPEDKKDGSRDDAQENAKGMRLPKKGSLPPGLQAAAKARLASMTAAPKGKKKNPFANFAKK